MASRKVRGSSRLLPLSKVPEAFTPARLAAIRAAVGVSSATAARFDDATVQAAAEYVRLAREPDAGEIGNHLVLIGRAALQARSGVAGAGARVKELLGQAPAEVRHLIQDRVPGLKPPFTAVRLEQIAGACIAGGQPVLGRMRPTGRRSRPTISLKPASPKLPRGRQPDAAEDVFVSRLAPIYARTTGRLATVTFDPMTARFGKYIEAVKSVIGASFNTSEALRRYVARRARIKGRKRYRLE